MSENELTDEIDFSSESVGGRKDGFGSSHSDENDFSSGFGELF